MSADGLLGSYVNKEGWSMNSIFPALSADWCIEISGLLLE